MKQEQTKQIKLKLNFVKSERKLRNYELQNTPLPNNWLQQVWSFKMSKTQENLIFCPDDYNPSQSNWWNTDGIAVHWG